jgi:hypothetical protein
MNLYTPTDPPGGLVVSDDGMHVDLQITSPQEICKSRSLASHPHCSTHSWSTCNQFFSCFPVNFLSWYANVLDTFCYYMACSSTGSLWSCNGSCVLAAVGHFISKYRFIYGYYSIYMKLIPSGSAGTIMTYYVSTQSPHLKNFVSSSLQTLIKRHLLLEFLSSCVVSSFRLQRIRTHRRTRTMSLTLSFSATFPDSPSPSKPTCTWMGKATGRSDITCLLIPLQTSTNTRFSGTRISSCQPLPIPPFHQLCFSPKCNF